MFRILRFLLTGYWNKHIHKWSIVKKENIYNQDEIKVGELYILRCEECGNMKSYDFKDY